MRPLDADGPAHRPREPTPHVQVTPGSGGDVYLMAGGAHESGGVGVTLRLDAAGARRVATEIEAAGRAWVAARAPWVQGLPPEPPPLVLPALETQRLACCLRDVATELARDGRADPLPIARLLAQAAEIVGMACPTCGGSGETGAYVGLGPGPRPDDVPERCPACEQVQHVAR